MSKKLRRLLAILLTTVMLLGLAPTMAFAAGIERGNMKTDYVYTEADNAALEKDVFTKIQSVKDAAAQRMGGVGKMTESDYASLIPQVIKAIESSNTYLKGSLQRNGNFLVWQTTKGIPCCYSPRMEAELHNTANDPTPEEVAAAEKEAAAMLDKVRVATRGGSPTSMNIGLIQPYWESSSSYSDSSFTSYSPYYKTMWQNLYNATGGSGVRYSMTNATVDNIAKTMEQCGLVIFDSHGTTDYEGSNEDYTSKANCSYLCLTTNSGVTTADTAAQTGTYGTYYHCIKGSGYAFVSGTCIANHMSSNAPHSMLYMGICLGMATDGMQKGLRAKGVEAVYGYSQSVSFKGEKVYMQSILGYVKDGDNFATAISKTKSANGNWDPAYSSYSQSQAVSNHVAFPIVVSSEDTYPGHGNVDAVQTVKSTWELFGTNYTVTATSNNTNYGTVSVDGFTITATPKTGYYAAGYTVTSGTATVVQNGNTFTVTPSSDCTVRINFAAKTKATVNYLANGASAGSASSYVGDTVTLPTTAATQDGYTFLGWVESTVAETTDKPTFYKPGATYTVQAASVTLYALYTRTDGGSGETVYELLTAAPSDWTGNYVITYGTSTSNMYVMKGVAPSSNGATIETSANAASYSASGVSLTGTTLTNVSDSYIFTFAPKGSYYTAQNVATGSYLGVASNSYLAAYTSYTSTYCDWTPGTGSNASSMKSANSGSYPYLSFTTNSNYFWTSSSVNTSVRLWKEAVLGTTYYTTSPTTTPTHEHSYGAWYSNNNGTHSRACSCGEIETENCTYNDVVTAPTTTERGYTTHTCTVCGYSYVDSYTDPVAPTYTVKFSVPSGVSAVASQTATAGGTINLPTAGAPSGYTFLGWVVSDYNNVSTLPGAILTGAYTVTGNITLKALYSHNTSGNAGYQLVTSAPTSWDGKYVITYGKTASSLYALKGLTGNKKYESATAGGAASLANSGMTLNGDVLTNVNDAYVFQVTASTSGKYTIRNAATGTYLASKGSYLYSYKTDTASYCRWALAMNGAAVDATNTASRSYTHLAFSAYNYFMINRTASSSIYFWKLVETGSTVYTTVIG